jgi:hypothetical protein
MKSSPEDWLFGFLTDYQVWATLLAAAAGFGGIIFTLVVQRRSDLELEQTRVEGERQRLLAALGTELLGVKEFAHGILDHLSDDDEFLMPTAFPFFVVDALSSKLDLLSPAQIQSVRHCYAWLREIPTRAVLLQSVNAPGPDGYVRIPAGRLEIIKTWFSALETYSDNALRDLGWNDDVG